MRLSPLLLIGATPAAMAHTPDDSLMAQIGHYVLAPHHLPFAIVAVSIAISLAVLLVSSISRRGDNA